MNKQLIVIAHRGDHLNFVENTTRAFESSLNDGADALEVDIRKCASGEIVVFHDFSLRRLFNKNGYIEHTRLEELKQMKYLKNGLQTNYQIETLDEFLQKFKNKTQINLDAKTIYFFDTKFAEKIVNTIKNHNLFDSVWVSCFNPFLLQLIKLRSRKIKTGYLFEKMTWAHTIYDISVFSDAWHPHYTILNKNLVKKARGLGRKIYVWTVNNKDSINRIIDFDIDGIITDNIQLVKSCLHP